MSTAALWFDKTAKEKKTEGRAEIEGKHASMSPLLRFKLKFLLLFILLPLPLSFHPLFISSP